MYRLPTKITFRFSTDYQYNLVRAIFTSSPGYTLIDAPYQMRHPKRLFAPLKLKPRKEHKKEKPAKGKKKTEVDTEDYLALLEVHTGFLSLDCFFCRYHCWARGFCLLCSGMRGSAVAWGGRV